MKRKSILLSLLLAIFVVGGMFAQEPTYSKMSPYTRILLDKLAKKDTANSLLRSSISGDYLSAFVMGFLGFGRVPYPDKDGRYRYGVDPPVCRGVGVWAGLYPICISLAADEGQYGLGPLLLGRGGCLCGD